MTDFAGRFEVLGTLGRGAVGVVYRARDVMLKRDVAIKVLPPELADSDERLQRFRREAESSARLSHSNILSIYDVGLTADEREPYMVMELVEGRDLRVLIAEKAPLTLEERARIVLQICEGLGYAHSRGVLHRDIKPSNVMVTNGGTVKIMDFGTARLANREAITQRGVIMGTPHYMSPEQVMAKPLDQRSDLFSAGCLAYELLGGRKAFDADSLHAVLFKVLQGEPEPLTKINPEVPLALAAIIHKMLAKEPAGRQETMAEVAEGIRPFATLPVRRRPPEPDKSAVAPTAALTDRKGARGAADPSPSIRGTLAVGTLIAGRYEVVAYLGKGGTGAVYKAFDRSLEETVAIKVLHSHLAADAEIARGFRSEIRLARRVTHHNVCRINEYGEDRDLVYISMELIEGRSFKEIVKLNPSGLLPEQALDLALQAARGLAAIHDAEIVHRDLKAANIMQDSRGVVKLMDFGIAKLLGAKGPETTQAGTLDYMSPEQALGQDGDARSDVYALGLVTYEALIGSLPSHGLDPVVGLFKRVEGVPLDEGRLSLLPQPLVAVLRKMLRTEPAERYASAREVVEALREIAPGMLEEAAHRNARGGTPATNGRSTDVSGGLSQSLREDDVPKRPLPLAEVTGLTTFLRGSTGRPKVSRKELSSPKDCYKVFIAYRRDDSADIAGRIHDRMVAALGKGAVFKDVDSIPLGANFREYLEKAVNECVVLIAVVGRRWLDARDEAGQRRLDSPVDWVRIEIETALRQDIPVIPLLVHGAAMPDEKHLPPGLASFATQNGAIVRSDYNFNSDVKRLIVALKKLTAEA